MKAKLAEYESKLHALAQKNGLDYYPVHFEEVPQSFMMEIAIYGLPIRMPHWSFGPRYFHQLVQRRMGGSRLFEVVFPGKPGKAYLASNNSVEENTLVMAHVLGHADFSKNNDLFRRSQEQVGYHIIDLAAAHARMVEKYIELHGKDKVEQVLNAALSLEAFIDPYQKVKRPRYPVYEEDKKPGAPSQFGGRFKGLPGEPEPAIGLKEPKRAPLPPIRERDLLWFLAQYAPEMEDWERDIFSAVREESFYFYPVFSTQIMNEGWASYWHARLMREADFVPHDEYVTAVKCHSQVVRPYAGKNQVAPSINPYHLGFQMWERIIEEHGEEEAFRARVENDDFSFIRQYLTKDLANDLKLIRYQHDKKREMVIILEKDLPKLHETILRPKYNFGAPRMYISRVEKDNTLVLIHDHKKDGRGLDLKRAKEVIKYIKKVWRHPVQVMTTGKQGNEKILV